jgi:hypothetical protein
MIALLDSDIYCYRAAAACENEDELQQVPLATIKKDFEGSPKQYNMGENTIRCVLRAVTKAMETRDGYRG